MLSLVRSCTGVGFAFFDQKENVAYVDSLDADFSERCRFYPLAEILRLYPNWKVERAGEVGFLVVDKYCAAHSSTKELVPHVMNAILLCKARDQGGRASGSREDNLLARLIEDGKNEPEGLSQSLSQLGINLNHGYFTAVVSVRMKNENLPLSGKHFRQLCERYRSVLRGAQPRVLSCLIEGCFAAAFFCDRLESASLMLENAKTATLHFAENHGEVKELSIHVGLSGKGYKVDDFGRAYWEATVAIRHAVLNDKNTVFSDWRGVGADRLLAVSSEEAAHDMKLYAALLELRLLQKTNSTPYFSTLVSLIRNHWNITATASALCLHYNSMKYRYDRIGALLGLDMDDPANRYELSLLVRSYLYAIPLEEFFELFNAPIRKAFP